MRNLTPEAEIARASRWMLILGAVAGLAFFAYYYRLGMTVAHYDAKAHLVVARRIVDSMVPGYAQMGVNWLPLLHLLYLPFVLVDAQYRTGFLPSLFSVASFALSGWLVFRITHRMTGSNAAGAFSGVLLLANPSLEYLQSCPLTEPVYMVLELLSLDALLRWREEGRAAPPWLSAVWVALAGLCRYEGWYFLAGVILLLAFDFFSDRRNRSRLVRAASVYVGVFSLPMAAHFGTIYARLGDSFVQRVAHGNPTPFETYKRPFLSLVYHAGELSQACGVVPLIAGLMGTLFIFAQRERFRQRMPLLLLWLPSLINLSALYWGMIYRVRYSVLLVPAVAVFAGLLANAGKWAKSALVFSSFAVMALPWLSWCFPHEWKYHGLFPGPGILFLPSLALVLLLVSVARNEARWPLLALCVLGMHIPALASEDRPMIAETLEHGFIEPERQQVLQYLVHNYDGSGILIDMSKLAPLAYDSGLPLRNFIYSEGDDSLWRRALETPEAEADWLCAENGDEVWQKLRVDPHWARKYSLVVHTANFLVYRLNLDVGRTPLPARRFE